jgi:DnaJ-class molecular chaperone
MFQSDYYSVLGVLPSAEMIVVRAAYRALAQKYHPDKWVGEKSEAHRRMKEINDAYEFVRRGEAQSLRLRTAKEHR